MAIKKGPRRKVLSSWNGYKVVQLTTYGGKDKDYRATGSEIVIQAGKRTVQSGFKTPEAAMAFIKSMN